MTAARPTLDVRLAPWIPCTRCGAGPDPGARALLAWGLETYRLVRSLGIYVCRPVRGGRSLSVHACGRAIDFGVPVDDAGRAVGYDLVARLGTHGVRLGVQLMIFDRTIWSATRDPAGERYQGVHPHRDHVHVELTPTAAARLNLATCRAVLGGPNEEDLMIPDGDEIVDLQEDLNFLRDRLWIDGPPYEQLAEDGVAGSNTIGALDEVRRVYGRSRHLGRRPSTVDADKVDRAIHEVKYHDLKV